MPEADQLRRAAREAESAGAYREALERYREALRLEREEGGADAGLLLRIGDLHARLEEPDPAREAYYEAADRYADQGLLPNAIAVCNKILRLYPGELRCRRLLAEHQLGMGLTAEARSSVLRCLEEVRRDGADDGPSAEGTAEEGVAVEAAVAGEREAVEDVARRYLRQEPDQDVCLELAGLLRDRGRAEEALDVLRRVWEERTGLREPAGDIEALAREIAPAVDLGAWTPVWPPSRSAPAGAPGAGSREEAGADAAGGAPGTGTAGAGEAPPRPAGTRSTATEEGTASPPPAPVGAGEESEEGEGGGRLRRHDGEEEPPEGGEQRFVRRYGGREGPSRDAGEAGREAAAPVRLRPSDRVTSDDAEERAGAAWPGNGGAGTGAPAGPGGGEEAAAAPPPPRQPAEREGRREELERGLRLVEELTELAPDRPGLWRRKVAYARRLGDRELLWEALLGLAEALAASGSRRGAWLVCEEVLRRHRPDSPRAASALESLGEAWPAGAVPLPEGARPGRAEGPAAAEDADAAFRRRLSSALRSTPRALEHLHAAADAAAGRETEEVPAAAHLRLGRFLLAEGRPAAAAEHLEAARGRSASEEEAVEALFHLGRALVRAGDPDGAASALRRLAELDPGVALARSALFPGDGPDG